MKSYSNIITKLIVEPNYDVIHPCEFTIFMM